MFYVPPEALSVSRVIGTQAIIKGLEEERKYIN